MVTKTTKILHKRGASSNLPTLNESEIAYTIDTQKLYYGTSNKNVQLASTDDVYGPLLKTKADKDENGIFKSVSCFNPNGKLVIKSVLSGGTSPQYTSRTITRYKEDGTTVLSSTVLKLTYDSDGDLLKESL